MSLQYQYTVSKLFTEDNFSDKDRELLNIFDVNSKFDISRDRIELHIFSLDEVLLYSDYNYRFYRVERQGSVDESGIDTLSISPGDDSLRYGFDRGDTKLVYNFVRDLSTDSKNRVKYFIESISPDRREIRAYTTQVTEVQLIDTVSRSLSLINDQVYLEVLKLNFDDNKIITFINIDTQFDDDKNYIIIKLYEALPDDIELKDLFSIEEQLSSTLEYQVFAQPVLNLPENPYLRGPNFNIDVPISYNVPSEFKNKEELLLEVTGSNYLVYSKIGETSAFISIDHSDYENFIHFSSAQERLNNFRFKLEKIQNLEQNTNTAVVSNSNVSLNNAESFKQEIVKVLENFDHYERFLFFQSGSLSWPKVSSQYPFTNLGIYEEESVNFFSSQSFSASLYDSRNTHRLLNAIPIYISDDPANVAFNLFIDMLGQHFDSLWVYAKAMSDRYDADNRVDFGISKDLVSHALSGFGVKLYGSSANFDNLFQMFVGEFYNTGSEQINTFITSSNYPIPREEYQKQVFKRIYHNIPLIIKSKGTEKSLRALINSFGIPSEVLKIRTFGGKNVLDRPFEGPFTDWTSSLDKVRTDNNPSIVPGNTLSYYTSILKENKDYTHDIHPIEVGFSPSYNIDDYIISASLLPGDFDMDYYIGDPRYRFDKKYDKLEALTTQTFSGSFSRYNLYDFIRTVKFFDNTLFKMIKDFTPARTNTATGIIIKSHILERNKIKQVEHKWSIQDKTQLNVDSNLDYSNGQPAYENNFSFYGNIQIGRISARHGNTFMSGSTSGSYDSFRFEKEYDTRYEYENRLPIGGFDTVVTKDESKYNGEFAEIIVSIDGQTSYKPHSIFVTDGELNRANVFKKTNLKPYYYLIRALKRRDPDVFTPDCSLEGFVACCNLEGVVTCGHCDLQGVITCCDLQGVITCCDIQGVITCAA